MSRMRRVMVAMVLVAGSVTACGGAKGSQDATPMTTIPGPYDYDYLIPNGTAAQIALGNDPGIMPTELDVRVGETIRIVNDDVVSHTVGTFYVLAGTSLVYRFPKEGRYEGECSTNPDDVFVLTVRA
ncbi:MAG: hypothetical protein RI958_3343 [Actinomycetota bacterium]